MRINFKNKRRNFSLIIALVILILFPLTILYIINISDAINSSLNSILDILGFIYKKS